MMDYKALLSNADAEKRERAIRELLAISSENAASLLGDVLLSSHWPACNRFAEALVEMGSKDAQDALTKALKARRHHVRSAAVKALSHFNNSAAKDAIAALEDDKAYEVREDVKEALAKMSV